MKKLITYVVMMMTVSLTALASDDLVASWRWDGGKVDFKFYSYESGSSGYLEVTSNTTHNLRVDYTYFRNDGTKDRTSTVIDAGKSHTPSCFAAGKKNVGIKSLIVNDVKVVK